MSSRDIICRVRALYAYESSDPSSLSFQPDAIIEVLAQLESGWWDGWSNGRRGWFPSNYVQVIPEEEDDEQDLQQWRYQQQIQQLQQQQQQLQDQRRQREQYRMSVQSTSPWVLQTTEDGSEQYYYNVHTQEMRYSMPPEDDVIPPMRPVRAANRVIAADRQSIVQDDFEQLPPNWVRKMTPRGRYYYCNVKTDETTWNLEDIDLDTGVLMTTTSPKTSIYSYNDTNTVLSDDDSSLSWHSLATLIAQSIIHLKDSVRQENNHQFIEDTTLIVHRIRLLLYVTNCLDKETSIHLKTSKQLRTLHRGLLASVAKLVLATKVASSTWPTPDSLHKLQSDADECLIAVRNFISHAQDLHIEFKESAPTLTFDTNTKSTIKSEPLTTVLILADNVRSALTSYWESVREAYLPFENHDIQGTLTKLKANAPLLVAQFRNLSNTASQFLDAIDVDSRKPIYEAMGTLFIVSQTITKGDLDGEQLIAANTSLIDCTRGIEDGIEQIIENTQKMQLFMLDTRDTPTPTQRHVMLEPRDTPTPTQRHVMLEPRDTPTPTQHHVEPTYMHGSSEELVNNIRNMTGDVLDDTSSFHSDLTASTQQQHVRKEDKIAKFFGEDTIAAARQRDTLLGTPSNASVISVNSSAASTLGTEFASILGSDVDPNEMVINLEGNVKGGTLHGLVVYLTQHDQLDSKFNTTFLLTYRSFCTTQELFNELFNRYQTPAPEGIKSDELELWKEKKLKLIRLRVFNVIKSWLETYFNDEEDHHILPEIEHFTDNVIVESMKFGAEQLSKLIKKRMSAEDSSQIRKMKLNVRTGDMPVPILPKNMKRIKLLELDPHELARQMTIMDFRLYNRIKPVECLDKNWGKTELDEQGHHIAANVKSSIEHSNQVTAWVTDSILSKEEVKKRAGVLKHWILVAERCRLLNNYNTCMAILSAFDNGSIGRMKRTWELISARTMQILQNIRRLMGANRNFSEYRDLIHKVNPPCIPFLGIYLQDLTFIEDGNSNFLKKSNSLINFAKRMKTAEVIRDLQQYQSTHYMLTAVPDIQEFIKTHLHSSREEEELYNLSLKLEPRERGEDTIARRLKESGL